MTPRPRPAFGVYAELAGTPRAAGQARTIVAQALGRDHPSADEAALIISELVGNAVAHSRSGHPGGTLTIAVEAALGTGDVRIQVRDAGGPEAPVAVAAGPDSEHGRGLAIITALAADWGTRPTKTGRATWCRLTATGHAPPTADHVPEREAG